MTEDSIPGFIEGAIYKRSGIHDQFGGSRRSGISASRQSPAIFIFTGESGKQYGYDDFWDSTGQVFTYTGEGTAGDMTMTGGNAAIQNHIADGRAIHLFETVPTSEMAHLPQVESRKGFCPYIAEMQCAGVAVAKGKDKSQTVVRNLLQFQLVRVGAITDLKSSQVLIESGNAVNQDAALDADATIQSLRDRALKASKAPTKTSVDSRRSLYERSRDVARYALARAAGSCECCNSGAPFSRKDGSPYLEVHHVDRVSDGGLDAPHKVAAICPTCHRRIHHGSNGGEMNDDLRKSIAALEASLDARGD